MTDHPLTDGSDQRQRRKRCLNGAQRIDERRNPFAVPERPPVNVPHRLVIVGPFLPDQGVPWTHDARLAPERSACDAINAGRSPSLSGPVLRTCAPAAAANRVPVPSP